MGELRLDELGWAAIWTEATWFLNTKKLKLFWAAYHTPHHVDTLILDLVIPGQGSSSFVSTVHFYHITFIFDVFDFRQKKVGMVCWHCYVTTKQGCENQPMYFFPFFDRKTKTFGLRHLWLVGEGSVAFPLCLSLSGGFGWPRGQPQKNLSWKQNQPVEK